MKRFISLLFFSLIIGALVTDASAEVYKRTNPDGSVEFSDVPSKIKDEPIELNPSSSYTPPPLPRTVTPTVSQGSIAKYESVKITSPSNDEAIRDNAGNLNVSISSTPPLQSGHAYILLLDGRKMGESPTGKFDLKNLNRGTHTLIGQIVDQEKKMVLQSTPTTVHLIRASVIKSKSHK